jgi:pimeloyl-ACP methyl ester carboxylesterase
MPAEVILPRVDMDMTEGRITRWFVGEGARVEKGQPIFEIETDKAAMEVEAPASGIIRGLSTTLDTPLAVGSTVAWIDVEGEAPSRSASFDSPASPVRSAAGSRGREPPSSESGEPYARPESSRSIRVDRGGLRATPFARRLARERGVDVGAFAGTGPRGRVQARDVGRAVRPWGARQAPLAAGKDGMLHRQWLRQGEGMPLVLLHGFGADLNVWRLFLAAARPQCPVLGIDLPGHGGSAKRTVADFEAMVDTVAATLASDGFGAIHLAGHSLGGAVATALAARAEIEARSLFLLAPAGLGPRMNGDFVSRFLLARSKESIDPVIDLLAADRAALGHSFAEATLRQRASGEALSTLGRVAAALFPGGGQAFSVRADFDRIAIPAKVVFGEEDRIIPAGDAFGLPGRVAVHIFPGIGHMPHFEAREEVAQLLLELMRSAS